MVISEKYNWENKEILIVEDDDSSSFLLGEILKKTGVRINFAFTGCEAVDFIREHPKINLVLMDIQLPDKDGVTATREIKEINEKIVVITQSAYLQFANIDHTMHGAADDFISKPINPKLLLSKINLLLE